MSQYAKMNLFVGMLPVPLNGHVKLPEDTKIFTARGKVDENGWHQDGDGDPWLLIGNACSFFVMIQLEEDQLLEPWDGYKRLIELYDMRYWD